MTVGALLLLLNPLQYLTLEAISAAAWKTPTYSYSYNYISDLGVPECGEKVVGHVICSPAHAAMNLGFVIHGFVFVAAALLLVGLVNASRARRTLLILAVLHGLGITLVAAFPSTEASLQDGTIALHGAGAFLAIIGGNLTAITAGLQAVRSRLAHRTGTLAIALGAMGIASFILLATSVPMFDQGTRERIAVYTVMGSEALAGTVLLRAQIDRSRSTLREVELA